MARLLCVVHEVAVQESLQKVLEAAGHSVVCESADSEVRILAHDYAFSALIVEITTLQDRNYRWLQMLRQHAFLKEIPILVYSHTRERDIVQAIIQTGVQGYICTPCTPEHLCERVAKLLEYEWLDHFMEPPSGRLEYGSKVYGVYQQLKTHLEHFRHLVLNATVADWEVFFSELQKQAQSIGFGWLAALALSGLQMALMRQWTQLADLEIGLQSGYRFLQAYCEYYELGQMHAETDTLLDAAYPMPATDIERAVRDLKGLPVQSLVLDQLERLSCRVPFDVQAVSLKLRGEVGLALPLILEGSKWLPKAEVLDPEMIIQSMGAQVFRQFLKQLPVHTDWSTTFAHLWLNLQKFQVMRARLAVKIAEFFSMPMDPQLYWYALMYDMGRMLFGCVSPQSVEHLNDPDAIQTVWALDEALAASGLQHESIAAWFLEMHMPSSLLQIMLQYTSDPRLAPIPYRPWLGVIQLAEHACKAHGSLEGLQLEAQAGWEILKPNVIRGFGLLDLHKLMTQSIAGMRYEGVLAR